MGTKAALITAGAAAAVILGGTTVAAVAAIQQTRDVQRGGSGPVLSPLVSVGFDDDDFAGPPLAAADWDKAASAALAQVGQGRVSEVERENEGGSAYEVEVRLDNGTQVEVQLGTNFEVLRQGAPEYDDD